MLHAVLKKMDDTQAERNRRAYSGRETDPLYVSVRSGLAACPAIDMRAAKKTADMLHATIEELDGACG